MLLAVFFIEFAPLDAVETPPWVPLRILCGIPLLCCNVLATVTSACCSRGMSAGHYLTTLAHQATQTVLNLFRVCYGAFIRRYSALVSYCWTGWIYAYRLLSYPFEVCADLFLRLVTLITDIAHICNAAINWWLSFALTIITTPRRMTCYALTSFNDVCQRFNTWAHIFLDLSSRARMIFFDIWTFGLSHRKRAVLWTLLCHCCWRLKPHTVRADLPGLLAASSLTVYKVGNSRALGLAGQHMHTSIERQLCFSLLKL